MNSNTETNEMDSSVPRGSLSIYGADDALDDFPVLKAFQRYIGAEQAKAQKRTTTLCIFFAAILVMVVSFFTFMLATISKRNETLIEHMMKEKSSTAAAQPILVPDAKSDAAVKALADAMSNMQKQMADQQAKLIEHQSRILEKQTAAVPANTPVAANKAGPSTEQIEALKKLQKDALRLKKEKERLEQEKEFLKKEKERLHQKEIELQRRKLYPELYREKKNTPSKYVTYFEEDEPNKPVARMGSKKAITYFDEEETVPPAAKKTAASEKPELPRIPESGELKVPIGGQKDEWTIPVD